MRGSGIAMGCLKAEAKMRPSMGVVCETGALDKSVVTVDNLSRAAADDLVVEARVLAASPCVQTIIDES